MIVVTGAKGMLGRHVVQECKRQGLAHIALDHQRLAIENAGQIQNLIFGASLTEGDTIINCAGRIGDCDAPTAAMANVVGPHLLSRLCTRAGIKLVHISSDRVYSGWQWSGPAMHEPYGFPTPADGYGRLKLAGEPLSRLCLTIRTAFVGPDSGLWKRIATATPGTVIEAHRSFYWSGSTVAEASRVILEAALSPRLGVINVATPEPISEFIAAKLIAEALGADIQVIVSGKRSDQSMRPTVTMRSLEQALADVAAVAVPA